MSVVTTTAASDVVLILCRACYVKSMTEREAWLCFSRDSDNGLGYWWKTEWSRPSPKHQCPVCSKWNYEARVNGSALIGDRDLFTLCAEHDREINVQYFKARCKFCKKVLIASETNAALHAVTCEVQCSASGNCDVFGTVGAIGALYGCNHKKRPRASSDAEVQVHTPAVRRRVLLTPLPIREDESQDPCAGLDE